LSVLIAALAEPLREGHIACPETACHEAPLRVGRGHYSPLHDAVEIASPRRSKPFTFGQLMAQLPQTRHLRECIVVEVKVLADFVEDGGDDLLLERRRIGLIGMLVRAPPSVCDARQRTG
jgi:hypothetical protein